MGSQKEPLPILHRDTADSAAFEEAVWGRVFNHRRDTSRRPKAVVQATKASHVKAAVEFAVQEGCRVSVRSGGHSWAGWSVRQDAVLIDLGGFTDLAYDENTKIVSCSPNYTGLRLNEFLKTKGRMFAGGHCPDVGLGGFLLQGGMGWNCKNWGWACESVVGVDVVTADARQVYCSSVENEDLFYAARGAGPGFPGIITKFHLMTRPFLEMYNCVYVYPISEYKTVLNWVINLCPTADPDTEIVSVSRWSPDGKEMQLITGFTTFKRSKEEAIAGLRPVHESHPPGAIVEIVYEPTSLAQEYVLQAAANPEKHRYCSENSYIDNECADVAAVLEPAFTTLPKDSKAFSIYFAMNPTSRRPLPDNMAMSMHSDHYFALYTVWEKAEDDARCEAWVRGIMKDVERHGVGSYMGDADFRHRRTRYWSKEKGEKLRGIRKALDPTGRICGYMDAADESGVEGLANEFEWLALGDGEKKA